MVPASLTSPICVIFHNPLSILSSPSHCEPPPLTDHYCSPPHEGRINPQVECLASAYDDPHHPSFLPTQHQQHQALIQDLIFIPIQSNAFFPFLTHKTFTT